MDINVQAFQDAIETGNFEHFEVSITPAKLAKDGVEAALKPVFDATVAAIKAGKLIQATLTITSKEPTTISLETGVINLPFADWKKVNNFIEPEEMTPINVYLIIASPYVNRSGLRIDEVTPASEYVASTTAQNDAIIASVNEKLATIEETKNNPAPEPKKIPASRAKTPAKKSTRRTTRKTAAKKPARKKTTTRKKTTRKASK